MKDKWRFAILVVVLVLGYLLGRGTLLPSAQAQAAGQAGNIICVIGNPSTSGYAPIVVVDTLEQTLLVYEYGTGTSGGKLGLKAARSMRYDRLLMELNNLRPTVGEVQNIAAGQRGGR